MHRSRLGASWTTIVAGGLLLAAGAPCLAAGDQPGRAVLAEDHLRTLSWRSVGPANMSGRVAALAFVPGESKSFYVGFATGGVFKTENMGVTFTPVFDDQPVASIGAIAVADARAEGREDAAAAKGAIVWVGTGEGNGRNSSSWGGGVYRSTDAGKTFTFLGLEQTHDIPRIAVDPRDPDVAYVAALGHLWGSNPERGVYRTGDGGQTWDRVLEVDPDTGACDVVIDPSRPDTVYAAMYSRRRTKWSFSGNSEKGGIFRSDDAGATWKKLTQGLPSRTGRIGLAVFEKDPRIVYASVESDLGGSGKGPFSNHSPSGGLFRSEDRGESWRRMTDLNPRPFYFSRVVVDPRNDQRVYLPGWDLGISDDGGRTFRRSGSELVHVDFHAMIVDPSDTDRLIVGNDGGVYISHDGARTWDYLNNVAAGQFYRVAVDMSDPYRIGGGLQDNGSWVGPSETKFETMDDRKDGILNRDWQMVYFGDGFTVKFDPEDPDQIYATSQGGNLARVRLDNGLVTILKPSPREGQERLRFNWDAPFLISKHDPSVLYHAGNKVFRLTDRGDLWFAISPDLTRNEPGRTATVGSDAETYGTVVSLAESPLRAGLLWAGTDDGLIQMTDNDGATWKDVTPRAVEGRYISYLTASQHDASVAYASVDGHRSDRFAPTILMTRDAGGSWKDITGDLPDGGPVRVVIEDPDNPAVLYCGTEFGAYVSVDRGGSWVRLNGDTLPPVSVHDMVIHPRDKDLVVATHGRSIYILDDGTMFSQLSPEIMAKPLALLDMRPGRPRVRRPRHYGSGHGIFRAKNPPVGVSINYWVGGNPAGPAKISIADPAGFVIRKLEGPSEPGLNRAVWDLQADAKHRFPTAEQQRFGIPDFVPAGEYTVTVSLGDETAEKKVRVLPGPGRDQPAP